MRGGTVVVASSPYEIQTQGVPMASPNDSLLNKWLAFQGLGMEERLILDPQNSAMPIPVERKVGGLVFQDTKLVNYPFFTDVRGEGLNADNSITSGLGQITLSWPSPIKLDDAKNQSRTVARLLESSPLAWITSDTNLQPDFQQFGEMGFPVSGEQGRQLLAAMVEGRFDSYFKDKPSPLLAAAEEPAEPEQAEPAKGETPEGEEAKPPVIDRVIDHSTDSARIILFASSDFATDQLLELSSARLGTLYNKPVELLENSVDWSLEDRELLSIRGRARFSRTLDPLDKNSQMFWEYLNYGLAVFGLLVIWLVRGQARTSARKRHAAILGGAA